MRRFWAITASASALIGLRFVMRRGLDSDDVMAALYFGDIAESGNFLLYGWNIPVNSYAFTEAPIFFLIGAVFGLGPAALKAGFFVSLCLWAFVGAYICRELWGKTSAAVFVLLVFASPPDALNAMMEFGRIGTLGFGLLGIMLIIKIPRTESRSAGIPLYAALLAVSFMGGFSDPFFLISFAGPAVLSLLGLRLLKAGFLGPLREMAAASAVALGSAIGYALARAPFRPGFRDAGFPLSMSMIRPGELPEHLAFYLDRAAAIFGAEGLLGLPGLALLIFFFFNIAFTLRREREGRKAFALLYAVFMGLLTSAAFILKDKGLWGAQVRYLMPLVFTCAIVNAAAIGGGYLEKRKKYAAVLAIAIALAASANAGRTYFVKDDESSAPELARYLDESGLKYGYAEYWNSNITTFYSSGRVKVRPVILKHGAITPHLWFSKTSWYSLRDYDGPSFLILGEGETLDDSASSKLGSPQRTLKFRGYTVLVWPFNVISRVMSLQLRIPGGDGVGALVETPGGMVAYSEAGARGTLFRREIAAQKGNYNAVFDLDIPDAAGAGAVVVSVRPIGAGGGGLQAEAARMEIKGGQGAIRVFLPFKSIDPGLGRVRSEIAVYSTGASRVTLRPPVIELR